MSTKRRLRDLLRRADRQLKEAAHPVTGSQAETEALHWLQQNANPSALATNRFGTTSAALAFVEELYQLGALRVSVTNISKEGWRLTSEGGPYADSLLIELPADEQQRAALLKRANLERKAEGQTKERATGQAQIEVWWD